MNWDLILVLIFFVFLYGTYFLFKKKFEAQGLFIMYKTKLGLKLMDRFSRKDQRKGMRVFGLVLTLISIIFVILGLAYNAIFLFIALILIVPGLVLLITLKWWTYIGIVVGYAGMIFMFGFLVKAVVDLLLVPNALPAVAPVLPGIQVSPGLPTLSFWHWILGILIIATIHEFSHGIYARLHKIKIKSSGFAFIGPLLAAFVEPDEKQLMKKKKRQQLSVLMAGPLSNILTGFMFLGLFFLVGFLVFSGAELQGIQVTSVDQTLAINSSGLEVGDIVKTLDEVDIVETNMIGEILSNKTAGEEIIFGNEEETWNVELSEVDGITKAGVTFSAYYGEDNLGLEIGNWFVRLLFWLWVISLGVGLFNLLPLGPVDGGRMFYLGMLKITKNKVLSERIWKVFSYITLLLIGISILYWIWTSFL